MWVFDDVFCSFINITNRSHFSCPRKARAWTERYTSLKFGKMQAGVMQAGGDQIPTARKMLCFDGCHVTVLFHTHLPGTQDWALSFVFSPDAQNSPLSKPCFSQQFTRSHRFVGTILLLIQVTSAACSPTFTIAAYQAVSTISFPLQTKNVSGRLLAGLRWWNEANDSGTAWRFETLPEVSRPWMKSWIYTVWINHNPRKLGTGTGRDVSLLSSLSADVRQHHLYRRMHTQMWASVLLPLGLSAVLASTQEREWKFSTCMPKVRTSE